MLNAWLAMRQLFTGWGGHWVELCVVRERVRVSHHSAFTPYLSGASSCVFITVVSSHCAIVDCELLLANPWSRMVFGARRDEHSSGLIYGAMPHGRSACKAKGGWCRSGG